MAKEDAATVTIFASDESDGLFISAVPRDPSMVQSLNNFTPMLGDAGEEFVAVATPDVLPVLDDGFFDVDQIVAGAEERVLPQISSEELRHMMPDFAEAPVNLDRIFDFVQAGAAPDAGDIAFMDSQLLPDTSASYDTALLLTVPGAEVIDPGMAIENLFKSLVTADES